VTASRSDGSGTLQGTLTAKALNGIASFTNLSHLVANTITIGFSSGSLTGVVSSNVVVNPTTATGWSLQSNLARRWQGLFLGCSRWFDRKINTGTTRRWACLPIGQ
jgi:hypothetical protein